MPILKKNLAHYASSHSCNEIFSWMIEIWMENDLLSGSNCNIVMVLCQVFLQGMRNNVSFTYSVNDNTWVDLKYY